MIDYNPIRLNYNNDEWSRSNKVKIKLMINQDPISLKCKINDWLRPNKT